jgi:uncharacterized protein (TIGR02996 family)
MDVVENSGGAAFVGEAEAPFIEAIHGEAEADSSLLVYADWLEERGDYVRAEYLRLTVELSQLSIKLRIEGNPYTSPHVEPIARRRIRMRELCREISPAWLAQIHHGEIARCDRKTRKRGRCPNDWARLTDTEEPILPRCEVCQENVRFCVTWEEFGRHAARVVGLPCI